MSGGSYNHLWCHVNGLDRQRDDIEKMAKRLEESGYYAPARATRAVLQLLDAAEDGAQALEDVWMAAEWVDSGSSSEESLAKAAGKFSPWPPEPPGDQPPRKPNCRCTLTAEPPGQHEGPAKKTPGRP